MSWQNDRASHGIIDEWDNEVSKRISLGFTHCIINNRRRALAWAHSYEGAKKTMQRMIDVNWPQKPEMIVELSAR